MSANVDPFKDLKVLVVEDNFQATTLIKGMLQDLGLNQVYTAKDGKEALDFLGACDDLVDVVLCDWKMPRMTGLELLQQIRTVDADMPFVMITAMADRDAVMAARSRGVTAYIRKPYSMEQIAKKLRVVARLVALKDNE